MTGMAGRRNGLMIKARRLVNLGRDLKGHRRVEGNRRAGSYNIVGQSTRSKMLGIFKCNSIVSFSSLIPVRELNYKISTVLRLPLEFPES